MQLRVIGIENFPVVERSNGLQVLAWDNDSEKGDILVPFNTPRRTATSYTEIHTLMLSVGRRSKGESSFHARSSGSGLVSNLMPSGSSSFWGVKSRPLSSFVDAAAIATTRLERTTIP